MSTSNYSLQCSNVKWYCYCDSPADPESVEGDEDPAEQVRAGQRDDQEAEPLNKTLFT